MMYSSSQRAAANGTASASAQRCYEGLVLIFEALVVVDKKRGKVGWVHIGRSIEQTRQATSAPAARLAG
jgi:hypothetical protein